jgi:SOS-response transcriptional repressor LexA
MPVHPNAIRGEEARVRLLAFLDDYLRANQIAPTLADMAAHLGYSSTYGIQKHLTRLAEQGLVAQTVGGRRTVHLTEEGRKQVALNGFKAQRKAGRKRARAS